MWLKHTVPGLKSHYVMKMHDGIDYCYYQATRNKAALAVLPVLPLTQELAANLVSHVYRRYKYMKHDWYE